MTKQLLLAAALLLASPALLAQDGPPQSPAAPPAPGMQGPGQMHGRQSRMGGPAMDKHGDGDKHGPMGSMSHLLPPGPWWRNPEVVTRIGLTADQTKRIDDLFVQSRMKLIDLHASLEKEQLLLEPLLNANPVDQGKALAEISKIADTRAELEKSDARMLLSIRAVLSADQWTKLQAQHGGGMRHGDGPAREGKGGQGGRGRGDRMAPAAPPQAE